MAFQLITNFMKPVGIVLCAGLIHFAVGANHGLQPMLPLRYVFDVDLG
jgi:hypothetical protein